MIFAKSGDLEFIKKINNSEFAGYIHSIFNKVINIYNTFDDEIYTLACKAMDNGPNTMVLDINEFTSFSLEVDDKIFVKNDLLYIEDKVTISIENIVAWTCCLPPYPFNTNILRKNLIYTKKYIDNYKEYKGINIMEGNNLFIKQANIMLNERVEILKEKLFEGESNIVKYATDLVGLGIGLTPSGDDFLVGLFTVINMKQNILYEYRQRCIEIANRAKDLTNDISYITLEKASKGQVRQSLVEFLEDITKGREEELQVSLEQLLNIGSSSGRDIAKGLVCGLEINLNRR